MLPQVFPSDSRRSDIFSGNNVVQSDATINNIYMLVALIPVLTCVLELIGIGAIFNLDKEQTKEMYAELKQRRE